MYQTVHCVYISYTRVCILKIIFSFLTNLDPQWNKADTVIFQQAFQSA